VLLVKVGLNVRLLRDAYCGFFFLSHTHGRSSVFMIRKRDKRMKPNLLQLMS